MADGRTLDLGWEHTIQHTDDVLYRIVHLKHITLSTNVTLINSIQIFKKENKYF